VTRIYVYTPTSIPPPSPLFPFIKPSHQGNGGFLSFQRESSQLREARIIAHYLREEEEEKKKKEEEEEEVER